MMDNSC